MWTEDLRGGAFSISLLEFVPLCLVLPWPEEVFLTIYELNLNFVSKTQKERHHLIKRGTLLDVKTSRIMKRP